MPLPLPGAFKGPFDSHNNLHRESYRLVQVQAELAVTEAVVAPAPEQGGDGATCRRSPPASRAAAAASDTTLALGDPAVVAKATSV